MGGDSTVLLSVIPFARVTTPDRSVPVMKKGKRSKADGRLRAKEAWFDAGAAAFERASPTRELARSLTSKIRMCDRFAASRFRARHLPTTP